MRTTVRARYELAQEDDIRDELTRFVARRLRNGNDEEDIVQETYLRIYRYRQTGTIANLKAFCFSVAQNLINDHFRRLSRMPATCPIEEDFICPMPRIGEALLHRERVEAIVAILKNMPPLRREIFLRRRLDDHPPAVIATDLDMRQSAVEKHVFRAHSDIRQGLAKRKLTGLSRI